MFDSLFLYYNVISEYQYIWYVGWRNIKSIWTPLVVQRLIAKVNIFTSFQDGHLVSWLLRQVHSQKKQRVAEVVK